MAKAILKDQSIYLDGYDLTSRSNVIALDFSAEIHDVTPLGVDSRARIGGLKTANAQAEGWAELDATDTAKFANVGAASKVLTFGAAGDDVGDTAYSMFAVQNNLVIGGQIGDVFPYSLEAESNDELIRSTLMLNSKAVPLTSTTNGTGQQVGAAASGQTIYAALHILGAGTGSATVTVESDATNSFSGSETTRITFDAATAEGSQLKTLAGPVTDTWWRFVVTISGGAPSFKLIGTLGII
jgi:hypothetical protein